MCNIYEVTTKLIDNHLCNKKIKNDTVAWYIDKTTMGKGRGVFASRDISAGEIICVDLPLIIGPRFTSEDICVGCSDPDNLTKCVNNCGLYICNKCIELHTIECAKILSWKSNDSNTEGMTKCLTPIRGLFLNESEMYLVKCMAAHKRPQHGIEVDILKNQMKLIINEEEEAFMRVVCAVLDANAFEVVVNKESHTLRGLYPLSSLINHSCQPNAMHVFDQKQHMIIRASKCIKKGEEIFNTYTRLIWSTLSRQLHLIKTKHFICTCPRCLDPTEFNTYMNAFICQNCGNGVLLPIEPTKRKSEWKCNSCDDIVPESKIGFITSVLGGRINGLENNDVGDMLDLFKGKIGKIVPESNQVYVDLKYRVIWIIGFNEKYKYPGNDEFVIL